MAHPAPLLLSTHALNDRLIDHNPCNGATLPKTHVSEEPAVVFSTAVQVERLASRLDTVASYDLLVRFAACTGLRAAGLAGLRVRDLDLAAGHVSVRQTMQRIAGEWVVGTPKSRRPTRDVPPMRSGLIADLRRYTMSRPRSGDGDALLWPGRNVGSHVFNYDRVLNVGSFRRNYFRPALRSLGMSDMRVHGLRHTAVSLWLAAGLKPHEVTRWLGHANITTTDSIYAHLYPSDYTEHIARFEAFVGAI